MYDVTPAFRHVNVLGSNFLCCTGTKMPLLHLYIYTCDIFSASAYCTIPGTKQVIHTDLLHNVTLCQVLRERLFCSQGITRLFIYLFFHSTRICHLPNFAEVRLTPQLHIYEVSGSNLGTETALPDWSFSWFTPVPKANARIVRQIRPPLPSAPFPVHCSLIVLSLNAMKSELLKASLNKPGLNKLMICTRQMSAVP